MLSVGWGRGQSGVPQAKKKEGHRQLNSQSLLERLANVCDI